MSSQIAAETLQNVPVFQKETLADIRQILDVCDDVELPQDADVFAVGDVHRALYILLEGTVEIELKAPSFEETIVTIVEPPGIFGESTFFHAAPHSATAKCLSDVRMLRLDRSAYDQLMEANSLAACRLGANVAEILAERLQATNDWITDLLQVEENYETAASWHRFRQAMSLSSDRPHGFFHVM